METLITILTTAGVVVGAIIVALRFPVQNNRDKAETYKLLAETRKMLNGD